eukprot:7348000-Pyramimonas_sp.AAC.1
MTVVGQWDSGTVGRVVRTAGRWDSGQDGGDSGTARWDRDSGEDSGDGWTAVGTVGHWWGQRGQREESDRGGDSGGDSGDSETLVGAL